MRLCLEATQHTPWILFTTHVLLFASFSALSDGPVPSTRTPVGKLDGALRGSYTLKMYFCWEANPRAPTVPYTGNVLPLGSRFATSALSCTFTTFFRAVLGSRSLETYFRLEASPKVLCHHNSLPLRNYSEGPAPSTRTSVVKLLRDLRGSCSPLDLLPFLSYSAYSDGPVPFKGTCTLEFFRKLRPSCTLQDCLCWEATPHTPMALSPQNVLASGKCSARSECPSVWELSCTLL